jgi:hypothetical protein
MAHLSTFLAPHCHNHSASACSHLVPGFLPAINLPAACNLVSAAPTAASSAQLWGSSPATPAPTAASPCPASAPTSSHLLLLQLQLLPAWLQRPPPATCSNCSFSLPGFSARLQPPVPLHQLRLLLVLLLRPPPAIRLLLQPQLLLARRGSGHRRHPACRGPHAFVHGHCPRLRSGHRRHPARGHRFSARLQPPVTAPIAVSPCPAVVQLSGLCCSIRGVFVRCLALLAQPLAVPPMRNCALFSTCPLLDYCFHPR